MNNGISPLPVQNQNSYLPENPRVIEEFYNGPGITFSPHRSSNRLIMSRSNSIGSFNEIRDEDKKEGSTSPKSIGKISIPEMKQASDISIDSGSYAQDHNVQFEIISNASGSNDSLLNEPMKGTPTLSKMNSKVHEDNK